MFEAISVKLIDRWKIKYYRLYHYEDEVSYKLDIRLLDTRVLYLCASDVCILDMCAYHTYCTDVMNPSNTMQNLKNIIYVYIILALAA